MADNKNIEYRILTPEEKLHIARQQRISFPFPSLDSNEEDIRGRIERGEYKSENTYGAVDESGRVIAGMEAIPFQMWFDGNKVSMAGISGVVSLPENRRQGNIRGIFGMLFNDVYEKGAIFTNLFPFSYEYYRQFGYELCGPARRYTLPLAAARKLPNNGSAHEYIEGDSERAALVNVYENFASRHNIMISRSDERWNNTFNVSLFSHERLYYWKDSGGEIKAWVKFKRDAAQMMISEIVWADHESMLGILQFVGMYEGAAEKMVFRSSPELTAELYWDNPYQITMETAWMGMSRAINAKRALELMRKPDNDGKFVIKLTDSFAKWNDDTYKVEYGGGQCAVSAGAGAGGVDIEVDERAFAQLILGVYDIRKVADAGRARINGNRETLESVFVKKPILVTDMY